MDVLQYHIFGNESLIDMLGRASRILQETAVCFAWQQKIYFMQVTCKRRRPNGTRVMCCGMEATYVCQSITQYFSNVRTRWLTWVDCDFQSIY